MQKIRLIMTSVLLATVMLSANSCKDENNTTNFNHDTEIGTIVDVDSELFLQGTTVTVVDCTLSDGTNTTCYQIIASTPTDHEMGPWCPDNISDDAEAGGIWIENGEVYDVDGAFIANMANFYSDDTWLMYDENGDVYVTNTETDCINAANPNVGEDYKNYCVECIPDYITELTRTWLIPTTPVKLTSYEYFAGMGPNSSGPLVRGIAFNGVEFSASAPVDNILSAYTLAPFDDAGGHINVHQGYHYHAATGKSAQISQEDGHAPMIGYAIDGHGIFAQLNEDSTEPDDLDACRGHYDDTRGYHYHVDAPGSNNFINCLYGAYIY
ncbi:YHYH protein [Reichenbachiella agariperforans]|uniref:YHYH protein n=1 Tax=Reichenbachiella agariperforans TaxID=156994 RepID=A0A1M6LXV4_REIAG|nr:YHYH protein [Reichenbachiella agariperforans]SHJ75995.1 YHYH protein [Reichenbachiella agariperforans]